VIPGQEFWCLTEWSAHHRRRLRDEAHIYRQARPYREPSSGFLAFLLRRLGIILVASGLWLQRRYSPSGSGKMLPS